MGNNMGFLLNFFSSIYCFCCENVYFWANYL